jgi:hypothetical protein
VGFVAVDARGCITCWRHDSAESQANTYTPTKKYCIDTTVRRLFAVAAAAPLLLQLLLLLLPCRFLSTVPRCRCHD